MTNERWHTTAFIILRVLQGVCEGSTFPAAHVMAARQVNIWLIVPVRV